MDVETCRICANFYVTTSEVEFVHLFQPVQESLQRELNFIINEINAWQLNIAPDDGLPQRICANCFSKFCTIEAFRQECQSAQNLLRKAMESEQLKTDETTMVNGQHAFTVAANADGLVTANSVGSVPEIVAEVTQMQTEAILLPPDIAINYNITYDENFVINNEGIGTVETNEACLNGIGSNTTANVQDINVNSKTTPNENSFESNASQDLEEMLTGSIIPKNLVDENANKKAVKRRANSSASPIAEEEDIEEEDDTLDDRPAQRIANFSFACNYCYCPPVGPIGHLIFKCSEALSQHFFDVHDPKSPYPCPKCPKLFTTNRRRNAHVSRTHDMAAQRIKRCPFCRKVIRTPLELHENSCTFLSDWKCNVCEREFRQMPLHSFRAHQRTHYTNPRFRCEICKRDFMRRSNFEAHKKVHEPKSHSCIECKQVFVNEQLLREHEWDKHKGKALLRCKYCDKGYSSSVFLQRHMTNMHSDQTTNSIEETTCFICSVTFPSKLKLYYHQQRPKDENGQCTLPHSVKARPRFSCPHCLKRFGTKLQLESHLELHDSRLRPYACESCTVRCRTALELKQHVSIAHMDERVFGCDECDERFAYNKDLENHKLYHATLTYRCSLQSCKSSFTSEEELSTHIRLKHEPIPCEFCGEIFTRNELKVHQSSESCLTNAVFGKENDTTVSVQNTYNSQNEDEESHASTASSSTGTNSNVCVQYVNEQPKSVVLKDDLTTSAQTQFNVLDFLQSAVDGNVIHPQDVPLNDDDYFISSLLDPDNEIVVT